MFIDVQSSGTTDMSAEKQYYMQQEIQTMQNNGMHLPEEKLSVIRELRIKIDVICNQFNKNIQQLEKRQSFLVPKKDLVASGMSRGFVSHRTVKGDNYELNIDPSTYHQIMNHCTDHKIREQMFNQSIRVAHPENQVLLSQLLELRLELAKIFGYDSYAQYQLSGQMVKNKETVQNFYDALMPIVASRCEKEMKMLLKYTDTFKLSDFQYYRTKHQISVGADINAFSKYFPVDHTFDQMFKVYTAFFGLKFETTHALDDQGLWSEDLRVIEVRDSEDIILGHIICDLHTRKDKHVQPCCHRVSSRYVGGTESAIAVVIADLPLEYFCHSTLITFFHEFGHAIHHMYGCTEMRSVSGHAVLADFIECPSQLLEEWMWNSEVLQMLAAKPIPEKILHAVISTKDMFNGIYLMQQCVLGLIALQYHADDSMLDQENRAAMVKSLMIKCLGDYADQTTRFIHLTAYGSLYYSYMWSKAIAIDLYKSIAECDGLLDSTWGSAYAEAILKPGGSRDPMDLITEFLGHPVNFKSLMDNMSELKSP